MDNSVVKFNVLSSFYIFYEQEKKEENGNNELEHKEENNHDQDKSKKTNILNRIKKPQESQQIVKPRIFQNPSSLKRKMEAGGIGINAVNEKEQNKKIKIEKNDGVIAVAPKKIEAIVR